MSVNILPAMVSGGADGGPRRPIDPVAVARTHERLERSERAPWLHGEVARRMAERLPLIRQAPQKVIDWWPHGGGSEAALRAALPQASIQARGARQNADAQGRRWWQRLWPGGASAGRVTGEAAQGSADLLWANMLLHHVVDPLELLRQWHAELAQDGFLMFSTLGPGSLQSLRGLYQERGWGAAMADLVDMHDIGDMLVEAGFADPVMDQEVVRLTWTSPQALLRELRTLGANASPDRHPGLRTPRWLEALARGLQERAAGAQDARIALEFEVVYGHALKPPPRYPVASETRIELTALRQSLRTKGSDRQR